VRDVAGAFMLAAHAAPDRVNAQVLIVGSETHSVAEIASIVASVVPPGFAPRPTGPGSTRSPSRPCEWPCLRGCAGARSSLAPGDKSDRLRAVGQALIASRTRARGVRTVLTQAPRFWPSLAAAGQAEPYFLRTRRIFSTRAAIPSSERPAKRSARGGVPHERVPI
jgi:hypothetical protein